MKKYYGTIWNIINHVSEVLEESVLLIIVEWEDLSKYYTEPKSHKKTD